METRNWTLDQLKSILSLRKEVKAWIVTEENVHRRERYFINSPAALEIDQDRNIYSRNLSIKLLVKLSHAGRHGEMTKKLFPFIPLSTQIDTAIEAALQTDHQSWDLPRVIPDNIPERVTTDSNMAEDLDHVMNEISLRIEKSVHKKRPSQFNSAELFLSVHHRELHLSNGLIHRSSQSRIYTESAFSFSKTPHHSDEYLSSQWAVQLKSFPVEAIFEETASRAEYSLDVTKPQTGKYSVLIDSEVLSQLIGGHLSLLTAANAYHGLPFLKPGEEFISESTGDLLSITLDPTLDFGANTTALSDQGLLQNPLKLVEQNRVVATAIDKQYGDYLGVDPTTVRGNIVVEAGKLTYEELTQESPFVIEILQFSGLFTDQNSGTFSSEIRLAKLYNNETGKVSYLKGGSLSGSIAENFRGLKLSKSRVNRSHFSSESSYGQGYHGPDFALLSEVSIVG